MTQFMRVLLCLFVLSSARAEAAALNLAAFEAAIHAAQAEDWEGARRHARRVGDPVAKDVILWTRLRHGEGEWVEYPHFFARFPDWPGLKHLYKVGEQKMPADLKPRKVFRYFSRFAPQTGTGVLRLAEAHRQTGDAQKARDLVVEAWRRMTLGKAEREDFLAQWGDDLQEHHAERLDSLLWDGETHAAEDMLDLVDNDLRSLAVARIAARRDTPGLMALISKVAKKYKSDPGLFFERYNYRITKRRWKDAEEYLFTHTKNAARLGRPEKWMPNRVSLARRALERGDARQAYALVAHNHGSGSADHAEAEWMAGFIALTRLQKPQAAIGHFETFRDLVATPISSGRAGYWLGLAHRALGNEAEAQAAFSFGAQFQTSFYGQLAAQEAGVPTAKALIGTRESADWKAVELGDAPMARAANLYAQTGYETRAAQFLRHMARTATGPSARALIAQYAQDIGLPHIALRIAKDAARERIILIDQYFPIHAIAETEWPVAPELALAIARRESEMNPRARSSAGARGLMQLLPSTAREVAAYADTDLASEAQLDDPMINARLGTAYLARLLKYYDGSQILAFAAYNAGPGRVDQWLDTLGDPRAPGADQVLWIESVPFSETRNYIMRVLEGVHVYRARLSGRAMPLHWPDRPERRAEAQSSTRLRNAARAAVSVLSLSEETPTPISGPALRPKARSKSLDRSTVSETH